MLFGLFERLEQRVFLSAGIDNGVLHVMGSEGDDHIVVTMRGTSKGPRADVNVGKWHKYVTKPFSSVMIESYGGNDIVNFVGTHLPFRFPISIDSGSGDDSIVVNSDERVVVQAREGNDKIYAFGGGPHDIRGGVGDDWILLEGDRYTPPDPDHPEAYANGEEGNDYLLARGAAPHTLDGGPGKNIMKGGDGTTFFYAGSDRSGYDRIVGGNGDDIVRVTDGGKISFSGGSGENEVIMSQDLFDMRSPNKLLTSDIVHLIVT